MERATTGISHVDRVIDRPASVARRWGEERKEFNIRDETLGIFFAFNTVRTIKKPLYCTVKLEMAQM